MGNYYMYMYSKIESTMNSFRYDAPTELFSAGVFTPKVPRELVHMKTLYMHAYIVPVLNP